MAKTKLDEILELTQETGLRVLPCRNKRPLIYDWPNRASNDPDQIRDWFTEEWPDAQVAAVVPDNMLVLDFDPRNEETPGEHERFKEQLPETLTSYSGRGDGGCHTWWRIPAGTEVSKHNLAKGIDPLDSKRYVMLPPSLHHETGKPYTWGGGQFTDLPDHVLQLLQPPKRVTPTLPAEPVQPGSSHGLVRAVAEAVEGERNTTLLWAACRAFDNGETDAIQDIFEAAVSNGLSEAEVTATINSAERQDRQEPTRAIAPIVGAGIGTVSRDRNSPVPNGTPAPKSDAELLAGAETATEPHETTWQPVDLTAYVNGTHTPAEPSLLAREDGVCLLYSEKVHSLNGESESGKTMVALTEIAEQIKNGNRVLFLDYESDPATVVDRLLKMGTPKDKLNTLLDYVQPEVDPVTSTVHELQQWQHILAQQYTLAVLDGVTESLGTCNASSMDNDEVAHWMRKVPRAIADHTGAATLLIDHVTKSRESRGRFAIGAQSKLSSLSGASYIVEPVEPLGVGIKGRLQVKVAKDRPGRVRPHSVGWDKQDRMAIIADIVIDSTNPAVIDYQISKPEPLPTVADIDAELKSKIIASIKALQKIEAPSWSKIRADVSGRNEDKKLALNELIAEGKVIVTTGPRNSNLHTVPD